MMGGVNMETTRALAAGDGEGDGTRLLVADAGAALVTVATMGRTGGAARDVPANAAAAR